jgi:hypothetical protein
MGIHDGVGRKAVSPGLMSQADWAHNAHQRNIPIHRQATLRTLAQSRQGLSLEGSLHG